MLNQKKVEIFLRKFRKSPAKQFLEIAFKKWTLAKVVEFLEIPYGKINNSVDKICNSVDKHTKSITFRGEKSHFSG